MLYRNYGEWCKNANRHPLSSNEFNRRIAKLPGVHKDRQSHADADKRRPYFWTGIGNPINMPPAEDDDADDAE